MNKVYLLSDKENKYIIRINEFDNNFECKVLELLKKYDYNCPKVITNFQLGNKYVMLYKYIEGNNPSKIDENFLDNLAILLKKLHSIKCDFKESEYLDKKEDLKKLHDYYLKAIESKYLVKEKELITLIYNKVLKLDLNNFDKCLVHSDIKKENMLQNDKELYLIDFGNCYIGTRIIDIIRVIMWFFIKNDNYDYEMIQYFVNAYFTQNAITEEEENYIDDLLVYCILYNLLKDIALYSDGILTAEYIEKNSLKWLDALKEKEKIKEIGEVIKNVKRFTK